MLLARRLTSAQTWQRLLSTDNEAFVERRQHLTPGRLLFLYIYLLSLNPFYFSFSSYTHIHTRWVVFCDMYWSRRQSNSVNSIYILRREKKKKKSFNNRHTHTVLRERETLISTMATKTEFASRRRRRRLAKGFEENFWISERRRRVRSSWTIMIILFSFFRGKKSYRYRRSGGSIGS